jgi:hypothetical protein
MSLNNEQRQNIVKVVESWYGTPYRGHSCLKGAGVDCGQLLKGVFVEAGHLPADIPLPKNYSLQVSQHRHDTEYIETIGKYMREITETEVQPGDVVVYKLGLAFAHAAIIKVWPEHIIHALERDGVTAGHGGKTQFSKNYKFSDLERKFYTLRDEFCDGASE